MTDPSASSARTPEPPADHDCDHGMSAHGDNGCIHCDCKVPGLRATPAARTPEQPDAKKIKRVPLSDDFVPRTEPHFLDKIAMPPEQPSPTDMHYDREGRCIRPRCDWHDGYRAGQHDAALASQPSPDYESAAWLVDCPCNGSCHHTDNPCSEDCEPTPDSGLDVERLARSMPNHTEPPDWGSNMHTDPIYDEGSIHDQRCVPMARSIAAEYARLARKPTLSGDEPPVVIGHEPDEDRIRSLNRGFYDDPNEEGNDR